MATVGELVRILQTFKPRAPVTYCVIQIDTGTADLFFEIRLADPDDFVAPPDGFEIVADSPSLAESISVSNVINFRPKR